MNERMLKGDDDVEREEGEEAEDKILCFQTQDPQGNSINIAV